MKLPLFTLLSLSLICISSLVCAGDYEVTIDGKSYVFTQGAKQEITLKDGQQISIEINPVLIKSFQEHGLSFKYPSDMVISQESFDGVQQITLESTDSTLVMIQVYSGDLDPSEIQKTLLQEIRNEYARIGFKFTKNPIAPSKRSIGNIERQGQALSYSVSTYPHQSEFYTIQQGGKTIAFMLQHSAADKEAANEHFEVITESFK